MLEFIICLFLMSCADQRQEAIANELKMKKKKQMEKFTTKQIAITRNTNPLIRYSKQTNRATFKRNDFKLNQPVFELILKLEWPLLATPIGWEEVFLPQQTMFEDEV